MKEGRTILEGSPARSTGCNVVVERAAQGCEDQTRVLLLALDRSGVKIDPGIPFVTFILGSATCLMNCLEVGKDCKVASERPRREMAIVYDVEFGQELLDQVNSRASSRRQMLGGRLASLS